MTLLEDRLYLALLGARTIVAATAAVNPQAYKILRLIDGAAENYKDTQQRETLAATEEDTDGA